VTGDSATSSPIAILPDSDLNEVTSDSATSSPIAILPDSELTEAASTASSPIAILPDEQLMGTEIAVLPDSALPTDVTGGSQIAILPDSDLPGVTTSPSDAGSPTVSSDGFLPVPDASQDSDDGDDNITLPTDDTTERDRAYELIRGLLNEMLAFFQPLDN